MASKQAQKREETWTGKVRVRWEYADHLECAGAGVVVYWVGANISGYHEACKLMREDSRHDVKFAVREFEHKHGWVNLDTATRHPDTWLLDRYHAQLRREVL